MKYILNIPRWFLLGLYTVITIIPRYLGLGVVCILNPKKGAEIKYKGRPIIPIVMLSLTLVVYFICIFWTSRWYVQRLKINYLTKDILDSTAIIEKEKKEKISHQTVEIADRVVDNQMRIVQEIASLSAKRRLRQKLRLLN